MKRLAERCIVSALQGVLMNLGVSTRTAKYDKTVDCYRRVLTNRWTTRPAVLQDAQASVTMYWPG